MGVLDVTKLEHFKSSVDDFGRTTGGRMDVLFNCAGILRMGRFEHIPPEQAYHQIQVNVVGVINGVYASLPLLEKTEGATILNMSSASAIYGTPELAVYSATKFAVRALTEALDLELRSKDIRVADIMPSYVATPMVHDQKYRAKSLKTVGVNHKAEHIAEVAWRAVNGKRAVHHLPRPELKLFARLAGFELLGRSAMRYLSKM